MESLTGLVRQHQQTEKKRKRDERKEAKLAVLKQQAGDGEESLHITVRNSASGEVLKGEEAPKAEELEEWLERNPGYEVVSRDSGATDSEDDDQADEVDEPEEKATDEAEKKDDEFEGGGRMRNY